ncbi:MAG: hypothetical protein UV63_C0008G0017 [Microgenomates group bacterium GW2011_GWC1_43_11]|nr:MAG: hypothetical protein UV63_C0008G0017 [Microgenomates group bacterium GW2011_GWC1_43_11]
MYRFAPVLSTVFLIALLLSRLHIGLVRFFDPDETANANWAYLISQGLLPYRDFFYYYTPLFHWLFAPFFLLPEGPYLIIIFRIIAWSIYVALMYTLYKIVYTISQDRLTALLSCFIFIVFPMTFDKVIEIRPDILMTSLFFIGVYALYTAKKVQSQQFFISGLCIAVSCLVFMKMIFAFPALLYLLLWNFSIKHASVWIQKQIVPFCFGFFIPFVLFMLYLYSHSILYLALDDIVRGSIITNMSSGIYFSLLDALRPWPIVYLSKGGITLPWIVQIGIWIFGFLGIPIVILRNRRFGLFIVLFVLFAILFLFIFRRPFVQYFIPLSIIVSVSGAYMLVWCFRFFHHMCMEKLTPLFFIKATIFYIPPITLISLLLTSYFMQYRERAVPTNGEQLEVLRLVHEHIPKNETVVDLAGSYLYRTSGFLYHVASYATYIDVFDPKAETLTQSLERNQTKYVVLDQKAYIFWTPKPDDIQFIFTHYLPSPWFKIYTPGVKFVCNRGSCIQYNLHNQPAFDYPSDSFSLHIKGNYIFTTEPKGQIVRFNGIQMADGEEKEFLPASYRLTLFSPVRSFILQFSK